MSHDNRLRASIAESARALEGALAGRKPEIGLVLGSGLGPLAERIEDAVCIPFADVAHMRSSTATSHVGRFVCGTLCGKSVMAMQGRLHGYEGYTAQEVAYPIWVMSALGVKTLITTNAAGAINASYAVGDFCIMSDHINFTGRNPVAHEDANDVAFRFFSMFEAYDPSLRALAHEVAREHGVTVREGVYLGLLGPSFETPAEIRAFRLWGADTVAMSVVEEVIAARHVGMRVLGMSLVTNMACGIESASPNDTEVLQVARERESDFARLITGIVGRL